MSGDSEDRIVRLATASNPQEAVLWQQALEAAGIKVTERISAEVEAQDSFERYLRTKQEKMGHIYGELSDKAF